MRLSALVLASTAACLLAGAARAQALQDRYDPPTQAAATAYALRGTQNAVLTWPGKVDVLRGAQGASDGLRGPVPLDTSTGQAVRGANAARFGAAQTAAAQPLTRISAPANASAPAQIVGARPATPIYAQPIQPAKTVAKAQPQADQSQGPVQSQGQGQPPAQTQAQTAAADSGGQPPHFYSLHREYGLTPDPVPAAEPSVLALGPTVAAAMQDTKDDSPPIDLAGEDQAQVAAPPRLRNPTTSSTTSSNQSSSTSSDGTTTTTYNFKN